LFLLRAMEAELPGWARELETPLPRRMRMKRCPRNVDFARLSVMKMR